MYFCKVIAFYFVLQVLTLFINVHGQCPWKDDPLASIPNAYRSSAKQLTLDSKNLAYGYFDVKCKPGYFFNPPSNGRIECLQSGAWSQPLPACQSTGRCAISELSALLNTYGVLNDNSTNYLYTDGQDDTRVFGGSNITVYCADEYHNVGGSLTIVCTQNNNWTPFPQCTLISARCPVTNDTWIFPNGSLFNTDNILSYSDNTAKGSIVVSCDPGYTVDSTSNGVFTCNNGTWSPRPYCITTGRCLLSNLYTYLNTDGINYDGSNFFLYTDGNDDDHALGGSNITVYCADEYHNVGGSLTIICTQDNSWTPFPQCTLISARCPVTNDTWIFPNGYLSNTKNAVAYQDNTFKGYVVVSCNPGYGIDLTSRGVFKCDNGTLSPRPYCTKTPRCAPSQIDNFVNNTATQNGVRLASRTSNFVDGETDAVLVGSSVTFACLKGYRNPTGSLKVICTTSGQWSAFPSCTV